MKFGQGIYFDEFCYICDNITSELYYCILDTIFHYVPCAQNFIYMRNNFMDVVKRAGFVLPDEQILPSPLLQKSIQKTSEYERQRKDSKLSFNQRKRFFKRENSLKKSRQSSFDNADYTDFNQEDIEILKDFQVRHPSPSIKTIEEEKSSKEQSKNVSRV